MPPDLRRQVERRLKDADKTARAAIKQLQVQVQRATTRADVNSVLKRIDGLTKQARQIASGAGARTTATRRRPAATTRRAASTRVRKAAPARRAAPTRKTSTARASAPRRTPAPRRRRAAETVSSEPTEVVIPVAEVGEVEVYEITER